MNLQSEIAPELWTAVSKSYGAADYTNSITDAVRHLFDIIRDKAGVEIDGAPLVGQALGGDTPILRLNKLQTQSEKDEQKGFQDILRGIYSGVRNPRSHEKLTDSQETADAIIIFVNYLLGIVDKAKQPFTVEGWIERIYDPFFVESKEYAEELVREIPVRKRYETLVTLYRSRNIEKIDASRYAFSAFYTVLGEAQIKEFLKIVSNELRIIKDKTDIKFHFEILRPDFWSNIDKAARMRIEGVILKEIEEGMYEVKDLFDEEAGHYVDFVCTKGWLGTWAVDYIPHFLNTPLVVAKLWRKMRNSVEEHRDYVTEFFLLILPTLVDKDKRHHFVIAICDNLVKEEGQGLLAKKVMNLPLEWNEAVKNLMKEKDENLYNKIFGEDIPF